MSEIKITEQNFSEEVLNSDIPVLVDFWATWCGPCKMIAPIVSEIAEEYKGRVKVGKVNVDENMNLSAKFQISSIPSLILFKKGKVADIMVGLRPKEEIVDMIDHS